jgi:hypothetical protein
MPRNNLIPMRTSHNPAGSFLLQDRLHKINRNGDPLAKINEMDSWEVFCPVLENVRDKGR